MKRRTKRKGRKGDNRAALAELEASLKHSEEAVEWLRAKVYDDFAKFSSMPKAGSLWKKHPSFKTQDEPDWTWTYVFMAWGDPTLEPSKQYAVLQRRSTEKPREMLRRAVEFRTFVVEYVKKKPARKSA